MCKYLSSIQWVRCTDSQLPWLVGSSTETGSQRQQTQVSKTASEAMNANGQPVQGEQAAAGQAAEVQAALVQLAVQTATWQQRELQLTEAVELERGAFLECVVHFISLLPFPFLKSLLKLLLLCCQASSRQVLPNSKHQTLILKTTSPPSISLSKVFTKTAASVLPG